MVYLFEFASGDPAGPYAHCANKIGARAAKKRCGIGFACWNTGNGDKSVIVL
jgi:hypothetical protein